MVSWFFWLEMVITAIFFILVMILFVCQWIIYYDEHFYSNGDDD